VSLCLLLLSSPVLGSKGRPRSAEERSIATACLGLVRIGCALPLCDNPRLTFISDPIRSTPYTSCRYLGTHCLCSNLGEPRRAQAMHCGGLLPSIVYQLLQSPVDA
jgi:hypothetical protein